MRGLLIAAAIVSMTAPAFAEDGIPLQVYDRMMKDCRAFVLQNPTRMQQLVTKKLTLEGVCSCMSGIIVSSTNADRLASLSLNAPYTSTEKSKIYTTLGRCVESLG